MTAVVRFAPSPTGNIHIGNLRAALINYLFALKEGGEFILRIDDTDQERSKEEYVTSIMEDLEWLGLKYAQTFRQSSRFDRYEVAADLLKKTGRLYPCYETADELDFMRKRQLSQGKPPIYNRQALDLTAEQIKKYEGEGRKPHWRFKLLSTDIEWTDLIRGEVRFNGANLSDPVLIREDGIPLYTLPSVVDDMDYGVTHIVRGEDHVTNTAVQIQILEALETLPGIKTAKMTYGHFTLIADADGKGFSKRLGSLSIQSLRGQGIEPMAIHSLLAKLGTSDPMEPYLSLQDLANSLDFSKFSRATPKFDVADLERMNTKYLHHLPFKAIEARLRENIPDITEEFWKAVGGNVNHLAEIRQWWDVCHKELNPIVEEPDYIKLALDTLPVSSWDVETWTNWTNILKEKTGRKGKELFMPLRLAITGESHGPDMKAFLPLIDKALVIKRLGTAR